MNPAVESQAGRVSTEGDDLYYEVYGHGKPLLMIPPAGGDGWSYAGVARILADDYKVITFDRRANARSTANEPQNFEISQQSRDAVAVLHATSQRPNPTRWISLWHTSHPLPDFIPNRANGSAFLRTCMRPDSGAARRSPRCASCSGCSCP
jgi:hypothetical protein